MKTRKSEKMKVVVHRFFLGIIKMKKMFSIRLNQIREITNKQTLKMSKLRMPLIKKTLWQISLQIQMSLQRE